MDKIRVDFTVEEDVVKKAEELLCYAEINGQRVRIRSLASLVREAFLRGLKEMVEEERSLREALKEEL